MFSSSSKEILIPFISLSKGGNFRAINLEFLNSVLFKMEFYVEIVRDEFQRILSLPQEHETT